MVNLENVSTDDLRQVLAEVEGKKPAQRLMVAINYLEDDDLTHSTWQDLLIRLITA